MNECFSAAYKEFGVMDGVTELWVCDTVCQFASRYSGASRAESMLEKSMLLLDSTILSKFCPGWF